LISRLPFFREDNMKIVDRNIESLTLYSKYNIIYSPLKWLIDIFVSITALVILLPLLLIICILIQLDSNGPVFFIQERIGKDGKPFNMIKFRTMYIDAEKNGPQWAIKNDSRITRIGYFLRKYRLDETPQFINIIKGEMSLIGPRPERLVFIETFKTEIPYFEERLIVKPGITGWAQINGGYDLTPKEKLNLDLFYIKHLSFVLDLRILLQSILVILLAKGWR
jgi:exopolysaccharide biosynthesis polyprenyl glycosylphosphotransferase